MKITKEKFIEEFIPLCIAQGEAYDAIFTDKWKETRKITEQLSKKLCKYNDFLVEDPLFAKETLDKLVRNDDFYVMSSVAYMLWEFDYRMTDCYKLFEKIISNKEKKHQPSVIAVNAAFFAIKEGRLKKRREYPKIDLKNGCLEENFLSEPEEWFYEHYDYLFELAIRNNFNDIPLKVKVYFIVRVLFDEVMNGGFGQYLSNSSGKLSKYLLESVKFLNNKKLIKLIEKFYVIIDGSNKELSHKDSLKLEELSNDFYDIEDEYNLYDLLDSCYSKMKV